MNTSITIVDYGVGNLLSVARAFEHCGAEVTISDSAETILNSDRLLLPGVGAFADGMAGLAERGLIDPLRAFAESDRPFMGICLGMQLMFEVSEEFGEHRGLSIIPGRIQAVPTLGLDGMPHKIPHIGWNQLVRPDSEPSWNGTILEGVAEQEAFYFVHSYAAVPLHSEHRLADTLYDGQVISAVIRHGSVYGCQFHPEKSGHAGLRVIENFCALALHEPKLLEQSV